jgi:hypothetical protein
MPKVTRCRYVKPETPLTPTQQGIMERLEDEWETIERYLEDSDPEKVYPYLRYDAYSLGLMFPTNSKADMQTALKDLMRRGYVAAHKGPGWVLRNGKRPSHATVNIYYPTKSYWELMY